MLLTPGTYASRRYLYIESMKRVKILCACLVMLLSACSESSTEGGTVGRSAYAVDTAVVQKYLRENVYIDVDMKTLARAVAAGDKVDAVDMARVRVALYRYFSHVEIMEEHYRCSLRSGEEIAVSSRVFDAMQENLRETNKAADEMRSRDTTFQLPPVDSAYRASLLK